MQGEFNMKYVCDDMREVCKLRRMFGKPCRNCKYNTICDKYKKEVNKNVK